MNENLEIILRDLEQNPSNWELIQKFMFETLIGNNGIMIAYHYDKPYRLYYDSVTIKLTDIDTRERLKKGFKNWQKQYNENQINRLDLTNWVSGKEVELTPMTLPIIEKGM